MGKIPVSFEGVDTMSLTAHKFYGLNGIGLLLKRRRLALEPQMCIRDSLNGELAIELPSIAEKKAYIAKQLTEETWESELRIEMPHKHYVNMTPVSYTHLDVYKRQALCMGDSG